MSQKIAVIGAGPGGMTAALILAGQGFDVTVFERGKRVGGRNASFTQGGYTHDIGPTFLMMKYLLDEVFAAAGERSSDWIEFMELDPMYRLVFPDFVYEPTTDLDRVKAQLAARFPGSEKGVDRFMAYERARFQRIAPCLQKPYLQPWDLVNPRTMRLLPDALSRKSVYDVLKGYFGEDQLAIAFSFQSKYLGMSPWECPGFFSMLAFIEYEYGVYHVKGGLSEISTGMAKAAQKHGCKIRLETPIDEIVVKRNQAKGVRLEDGSVETFDDVVVNADFGYAVTNLFPEGTIRNYTPERLRKLGISCSTFMLYLGVDREYPDHRHHTIYFAEDYENCVKDIFAERLPRDYSIYVRNASATDPTLAPSGHSSIYVLVPMPNCRAGVDWAVEAPRVRERTLELLESRCGLANLRQHIREERMITPADWRDRFNVFDGATFNLAHTIPQMLYFRPRNKFEEVDNCYLVGGGTHPGSGLPTIYESGRITANLLLKRYGKPEVKVGTEMPESPGPTTVSMPAVAAKASSV